MIEFKMPDIGEGVAEGEIVKWLVKEGDAVADDQAFVEVMTDKATVVIPCPTTGTVRSILVAEGKTARVGQALVVIAQEGDAGGHGAASSPAPAAALPTQAPQVAVPPTAAPAPAPQVAAPPPAAPSPAPQVAAPPPAAPAPHPVAATVRAPEPPRVEVPRTAPAGGDGSGARVLAAPATRRAAREAGVDLSQVPSSGPHGRVTREDLLAFLDRRKNAPPAPAMVEPMAVAPPETWPGELASAPTAAAAASPTAKAPAPRPTAPPVAFAPGPRPETRIPVRGIRRKIAENMRRSKDRAAHFTYVEECDMTELGTLRASVETVTRERGIRLSYLPFIVKAVTLGLRKFPHLNASYDEEAQEIVLKGHYGIGIAASTDDGLMVPVVKDCDRRGILEIAAEIQRLADGARQGTLLRDDLTGGTFTITSLGRLGGVLATPVINWPEVAILGVHRIRKRPVVKDDQVVIRDICYLSISIDHRVVDGQMGAEFMEHVVRLLEDPRLLLLG